MCPNSTTTGLENALDEALIQIARTEPAARLQALGMFRWLAAAQDGSNETAQQSLNDIEDLATAIITGRHGH